MSDLYDYKKYAILYVDDEEKSLKYFTRAFNDEFRVLTAATAEEGFKLLEQNADSIGLLLTDQRMPGEQGVWLLEKARQFRPHILRILVTAYSDTDAMIAAVNSGAISKFITKPWDAPQLELILRQSLEFFMVAAERDQLLREKLSVLRNMMIADRIVSLGLLAAGLSHHIKNSMVAVKTFLELAPVKMAEEKAGGPETLRDPGFWQEYHQNAQNQIQKITDLIADLRTASDDPAKAPFADQIQVQPAIARVLAGLQAEFAARRLTVENHIPENLPALSVDLPKFNRLFELLFKDELAMLPAGSQLRLAAEAVNDGGKPGVIIRLTDNGPALPPDALRVVLDPFTGGASSEYGINLMACFFIVHHHGGTIEAVSPEGGGNIFHIRLPLKPEVSTGAFEDTQFLKKALLNDKLWNELVKST